MKPLKILIVGSTSSFSLETSYATAVEALGHTLRRFDPSTEAKKYIRFGKIGYAIQSFVQIESWEKKVNRDLVIEAKNNRPDVILIVKGAKVHYGTVATIKVILPHCKIVWIWPDTPLNLNQNNISCASIIDLSAIYSDKATSVFRALGFKRVEWIPLAGDVPLHGVPVSRDENFDCDISFVGMWRPEREKVMSLLVKNFPNLTIEIFGENWKRDCKDKAVQKRLKGNGIYSRQLGEYFNKSRININVIDDTNYPAANMRFFEILTAGGLEVCSSCPEMESIFKDEKEIIYFKDDSELVSKINWVLANANKVQEIRNAGQIKINESHNYSVRLEQIVNLLYQ